MILHLAGLDKFIPAFIKLVKEEFHNDKHQFWIIDSIKKYPLEHSDNVYICGSGFWSKLAGYTKLVMQIHSAQKIMLHGLFNLRVILVLALFPWVLPKCHWIIWGSDLYQYTKASNDWVSRIKEPLRRFVIRRIGHLVTYIEGDIELARKWYGAKGTYHECIMYLSNVVDPKMTLAANTNPDHDRLNILLGNSADPSNNHIEALERLLPFKDNDIMIYAPLSYGDQNHAKNVTDQGKEWFGCKFVPMLEFMLFEQYLEFLKSLDIAIFNHQRQQAMGNTITLLGMGKTVFMRSGTSHWHLLKSLGIKLNDVVNIELYLIESDEAEENVRVVSSYFSKETLVKQLSDIFEG